MEYERVHQVQTGIISPSKLRMKLMGPQHQRKKDGSNSESSRTSPSKLEDSEFVKNRLLATRSGDFEDEVQTAASSLEVPPTISSGSVYLASQGDGSLLQPKDFVHGEDEGMGSSKMQLVSVSDGNTFSSIQAIRAYEDEILDYDSMSSFEFQKGEQSLHHPATRSFSRPLPSKWNDAEKWIMNRQNIQSNYSKKTNLQNQVNGVPATNTVRVETESGRSENKLSIKRVDFCQPSLQTGSVKFSFASQGAQPILGHGNGVTELIDVCPESKDLMEVDGMYSSCPKTLAEDTRETPAARSVSMRDMGTEMTPTPSQEPSRTATPVGATTPLRSPNSSLPSTPRRGEPATMPTEQSIDNALQLSAENGKTELSDQEKMLKTRREIVALGVQLGKVNIAAWASKEEKEKGNSGNEPVDPKELERIEYEKGATAWEEAEKSKHSARFKREEIRIEAWECQQKAKLEAKMRKIEARIEQMRVEAQAKIVKKIAKARQKSDEMRAAAEARKNRKAEKTAANAEYIRQTGQIPSSTFTCCGWFDR